MSAPFMPPRPVAGESVEQYKDRFRRAADAYMARFDREEARMRSMLTRINIAAIIATAIGAALLLYSMTH